MKNSESLISIKNSPRQLKRMTAGSNGRFFVLWIFNLQRSFCNQLQKHNQSICTLYLSRCILDSTMSFERSQGSSAKHFKIKAFRFFGFLDGYTTVYVHCELMACHVHTANSRCSRGCQRSYRKRREIDVSRDREEPESESSKKYALSTGAISKKEQEKPVDKSGDAGGK